MREPAPELGAVQVAIWKDPYQPVDLLGSTSESIFFDFSKPLRIFDSPTWNSQITTQADDDFFVLSFKEQG